MKRIHVFVVKIYLDTLNAMRYIKAKITGKKMVFVHYARVNNFGDQFNNDLVRYFGAELIYKESYKKSQMALTGSILGSYLRDYKNYILGAGFIASRYDRKGNSWNIKIIRGPLSAAQCGASEEDIEYADPGILASLVYPKPVKKKYLLGIVPHSKDVSVIEKLALGPRVKMIHPRRKPAAVAYDIKQCEHIVSSSLHGLIFADAFRIPNIHIKISDRLKGGHHKFKDYYQGMNMEYRYLDWTPYMKEDVLISHCELRCSDNYLHEKQNKVAEILGHVITTLKQ